MLAMLNWSRFGSCGWLSVGAVCGVAIATPAIAVPLPAERPQPEAIGSPAPLTSVHLTSSVLLTSIHLTPIPAQSPIPAPVPRTQAPPLFEDLFIGLNAPDRQARGLSGGPLPAMRQAGVETTSTGRCVGFVDREPDHRLTLSGFMDYLRLEVQSNADTSLVVRGPGGSWCNDNYRDRNPGMAGQWLAGTYEIWIGSPTNRDYYPYVLRVTQRPDDPANIPIPSGVP